jgi:hypothetical protein
MGFSVEPGRVRKEEMGFVCPDGAADKMDEIWENAG